MPLVPMGSALGSGSAGGNRAAPVLMVTARGSLLACPRHEFFRSMPPPPNACSPTCHRPNPTQTSSLLVMPPTSICFPQNLIHTIFPPIHLSTNNAFNIFHSLHALDDLKSLPFFTSIDLTLLMGASWGTQECGFIRLVGGM